MSTIIQYARAVSLLPIILAGVWFALLESTPERFITVVGVAITFGFLYALLTGVEIIGR